MRLRSGPQQQQAFDRGVSASTKVIPKQILLANPCVEGGERGERDRERGGEYEDR